MLELTRIFHPVGQGGFFTEHFQYLDKNFVVAYDCGSAKGLKTIKGSIDEFLEQCPQIDALFISHMHQDHINGVNHLLSRCSTCKIYMPELTNAEKLEVVLHYNLFDRGRNSKFILSYVDLEKLFINNHKIIHISKAQDGFLEEETSDNKEDGDSYFILKPNQNNSKFVLMTKDSNAGYHTIWEYIPFNPSSDEPMNLIDEIKKHSNLRTILNNDDSINQNTLLQVLQNRRQRTELITLYKNVFGSDCNAHSMPLYSGPLFDESFFPRIQCFANYYQEGNYCICYKAHREYCEYRCHKMPLACMYTGDSVFGDGNFDPSKTWFVFYKYYRLRWDRIRLFQIPHHGAHGNYNLMMRDFLWETFLTANSNDSHHPNNQVLCDLIQNRSCKIVTEEYKCEVTYLIRFR